VNNERDVTAKYLHQRRLTARNLQDFELCPQKYLLSLSISPAEARQFIGGPAALRGAVRATLIDCYRRGGPQEISQPSLLDLFEQHWEGELCADSLEESQLHSRGVRMLIDYYQTHHEAANQTIAVDLRLTGEIAGHDFVAVADRINRDDSGIVTLLRYNTSASPPGPGALAKDISAGLLLLLGSQHYASEQCQTAIYALRRQRLIIADVDADQRQRLREKITDLAAQVHSAQDFPTQEDQHCRWCRSRAQCPAWASAHYRRGENK